MAEAIGKARSPDDTADPPDEISVRLAFESAQPRQVDRWVQWLSEAGLSVIGSSERSIDLRGTVAAVESALDTKISFAKGKMATVGEVGRQIGSAAASPLAYIPQRPQYFP